MFAISTSAPTTVANATIKRVPVDTDKKIMTYQNSQKKQCIY